MVDGAGNPEGATELGRLGGTTFRLDTDDLAVFNALSDLRQRHADSITPWLRARRPASNTALLKAILRMGCSQVIRSVPCMVLLSLTGIASESST